MRLYAHPQNQQQQLPPSQIVKKESLHLRKPKNGGGNHINGGG